MNNELTIRKFEDEETQRFLRGILRKDQSVPFLGTGFTAGERARDGVVPFGGEWADIMRAQILAANVSDKPSESELAKYSFQELSDVYFREEVVDFEKIKETINDVSLSLDTSIPKTGTLFITTSAQSTLSMRAHGQAGPKILSDFSLEYRAVGAKSTLRAFKPKGANGIRPPCLEIQFKTVT